MKKYMVFGAVKLCPQCGHPAWVENDVEKEVVCPHCGAAAPPQMWFGPYTMEEARAAAPQTGTWWSVGVDADLYRTAPASLRQLATLHAHQLWEDPETGQFVYIHVDEQHRPVYVECEDEAVGQRAVISYMESYGVPIDL